MLIGMLTIHVALLAYSGYVHSPTLNEPAHLASGLGIWRFGRFDLYAVNPPLIRAVAAIPLLFLNHREEWSKLDASLDDRPEFWLGEDFVAANGPRSYFLLTVCRWMCIPFSCLGAIICYAWARELGGHVSGILACTIWCLEPNILAHASLITPDAHATSLGLAACYTFHRWLECPSWKHTLLSGIALGAAELAKSTFIILFPVWLITWIVWRGRDRDKLMLVDWIKEGAMMLARLGVCVYVLNLGYGFEGTLTRLSTYSFRSDLLSGPSQTDDLGSSVMPRAGNRFRGTFLASLPVPLPQSYVVGLDTQQRDFEHYYGYSYLRGSWSKTGWWYYYVYAIATKVPVGLGLISIFCLLTALCRTDRKMRGLKCEYVVLLLSPATLFAVASLKFGFSEHLRYVLPCFPFVFIFVATSINEALGAVKSKLQGWGGLSQSLVLLSAPLVVTALTWSSISSLWIFPHSLSYFNECAGGPLNGARHLLGSNLDWGQDLKYLHHWILKEDRRSVLYLAYYGLFNPYDVGVKCRPWSRLLKREHLAGAEQDARIDDEATGPTRSLAFFAVSANLLHGQQTGARSINRDRVIPKELITQVEGDEPVVRCGYSIAVYHAPITEAQLPTTDSLQD